MGTRRDRRGFEPPAPRQTPYRSLQTGPTAFLLGTVEELAIVEPVIRRGGMGINRYPIDPVSLDVEAVGLDDELAVRVERSSLAVVLADVSGDDRLPLISFIDDALAPGKPLLVSCVQAGATEQAAICQHQERVIGIGILGLLSGRHVIEVAATANTDRALLAEVGAFLRDAGLQVAEVRDVPGLVLARILAPLVNEAAFALSEGVAAAEAIDTAMSLGANFPFGPLHWADEVGIDRILLAMEYLVQATHEERYRPAPLLRRMAQAGHIGRASGRGFFQYEQRRVGQSASDQDGGGSNPRNPESGRPRRRGHD